MPGRESHVGWLLGGYLKAGGPDLGGGRKSWIFPLYFSNYKVADWERFLELQHSNQGLREIYGTLMPSLRYMVGHVQVQPPQYQYQYQYQARQGMTHWGHPSRAAPDTLPRSRNSTRASAYIDRPRASTALPNNTLNTLPQPLFNPPSSLYLPSLLFHPSNSPSFFHNADWLHQSGSNMFSPARYTRGAGASPSCAENVPRRWMKGKIH